MAWLHAVRAVKTRVLAGPAVAFSNEQHRRRYAENRKHREEKLAAIIVEQHAQKILPITHRALILERGRIVHQSDSASLLADPAPLERFLGVTGR